MSITLEELKSIFKESKKLSNNFSDLSKMLLSFPRSLIILRLATKQGRIKFSNNCKIFLQQVQEIEEGKRRLGIKRVERILSSTPINEDIFKWSKIKATFKIFQQIPKTGFFGKEAINHFNIDLELKRKVALLGLKSIPMNESEFSIFNILKNNSISFERQALLLNSLKTPKMIVIDFAIPDGKDPSIVIEVTRSKFIFRTRGTLNSINSLNKVLLGFRIKKLNENVKSVIVIGNEADEAAISLLNESFDFVIKEDEINKLPSLIGGILDANQNRNFI